MWAASAIKVGVYKILCAVAVPVRGVGCIWRIRPTSNHPIGVAVPVRGVGCIMYVEDVPVQILKVAVPVRGVGCIKPTKITVPRPLSRLPSP